MTFKITAQEKKLILKRRKKAEGKGEITDQDGARKIYKDVESARNQIEDIFDTLEEFDDFAEEVFSGSFSKKMYSLKGAAGLSLKKARDSYTKMLKMMEKFLED